MLQRLDDGTLDFGMGIFENLPSRFRRELLYEETYIAVMRKGHPALRTTEHDEAFDLDTYLGYPHLQVSPRNQDRSLLVRSLTPVGRQRSIACVINDYVAAQAILLRTNLIGTIPAHLLLQTPAAFQGLEARPLPVEMPLEAVELIWHERTHELGAHSWVRQMIARVSAGLRTAEREN